MCGIIGFKNADSIGDKKLALIHLYLRGPDFNGEYEDKENNIWLGHTRLAIQDLSTYANQPLSLFEDKNLVITFNGEIYNAPFIKKILMQSGYKFKTKSDTEILLQSYRFWGLELFSHIEGMFAFAIWDKNKKTLLLARDPIGQKPLYYYISNKNELYFASNLKALLAILPFKPQISRKALAYTLSLGYIPNSEPLYDGIKSLKQGHYLVFSDYALKERQYWSVNDITFDCKSIDSKQEEFEYIFRNVCREHLLSDVPVGLLLSGGLDSSSIALFLKDFPKLTTYSLWHDQFENSEAALAEESASILGLKHKNINLSSANIDNLLDLVSKNQIKPQGYSSFLNWYWISLYISKFSKVVISGDGGDEVLGGYRWYKRFSKKERILGFLNSIKNSIDFDFYKLSQKSKLHRHWILQFPRFLPYESCEMLQIQKSEFNDELIISNLEMFFQTDIPYLDAIRRVDLMTFCSDHICRKTDEMSMAHSLEVRAPFLDRRVIEIGMSHSINEYSDSQSKLILRRLLEKNNLKKISTKPKKGFSLNLDNYNFQKLINKISSSKIVSDGIINNDYLNILQKPCFYKNARIFTLANLSNWYENN